MRNIYSLRYEKALEIADQSVAPLLKKLRAVEAGRATLVRASQAGAPALGIVGIECATASVAHGAAQNLALIYRASGNHDLASRTAGQILFLLTRCLPPAASEVYEAAHLFIA
jgi:hypothetical protein